LGIIIIIIIKIHKLLFP